MDDDLPVLEVQEEHTLADEATLASTTRETNYNQYQMMKRKEQYWSRTELL